MLLLTAGICALGLAHMVEAVNFFQVDAGQAGAAPNSAAARERLPTPSPMERVAFARKPKLLEQSKPIDEEEWTKF
jgi:hypothetical protein